MRSSHPECKIEFSEIYNRFYILMRFFNIIFGVIFASAMFYFEGRLWKSRATFGSPTDKIEDVENLQWEFHAFSMWNSLFLHLSVYSTFNTYHIWYRYNITISRKRIPQFWRFSTLLSPVEIVCHQQKKRVLYVRLAVMTSKKKDSTSLPPPRRNLPWMPERRRHIWSCFDEIQGIIPVREKCPPWEIYISFQKPKTIHPQAMVKKILGLRHLERIGC